MNNVLRSPRALIVLLGPALAFYTLITIVPIIWSVIYTFFGGNAIKGFEFIGLKNYETFLTDPTAWQTLFFTLKYGIVLTILQVALGFAFSLLYVFWLKKSSAIIRTIFFFPVILPTVAVALLFQKMFEIAPTMGPVNTIIQIFGGAPVDWFGSENTAFFVLILMDLWRSAGFYAVLLYAGVLDIPEEIFESARLDGASGFRLVRTIVWPLSMPVLLSSLIFSINGTLKVFDSIVALTNGGPGTSTTPLTLYMFDSAFSYGQYGYGSTIAMMLTIISLIFTIFIFRSTRKDLTNG